MKTLMFFLSFVLLTLIYTQEQVVLQLTGVQNQYTVLWQTKFNITSKFIYGYEQNNLNFSVEPKKWFRKACRYYNSTSNEVVFTVLPNRFVYYQVISLFASKILFNPQGTEVFKFKSAPDKQENFEFLFYSDTAFTSYTKFTSNLMSKESNSAFTLHGGDFAYDTPYNQEEWDQWSRLIEHLSATSPYVTVVGNHERHCEHKYQNYKNRYTELVGKNSNGYKMYYYTFTYSYVFFIIVSSEESLEKGSEQYKYILNSLRRVNRKITPFVIVSVHKPLYTSLRNRFPGDNSTKPLEELYKLHKVDLVLQGHNHNYERTCAIYNLRCDETGPVHIVVGTGGSYLYTDYVHPQPVWSVIRESEFGYLKLRVTKDDISGKFLRLNGTIGDEFIIKSKFK